MPSVSPIAPGRVAATPIAPRYVSPREAATYTGIKLKTLEQYRRAGQGPAFSVAGRAILYRLDDLDAYLAARRVKSTAEAVALRDKGGAR